MSARSEPLGGMVSGTQFLEIVSGQPPEHLTPKQKRDFVFFRCIYHRHVALSNVLSAHIVHDTFGQALLPVFDPTSSSLIVQVKPCCCRTAAAASPAPCHNTALPPFLLAHHNPGPCPVPPRQLRDAPRAKFASQVVHAGECSMALCAPECSNSFCFEELGPTTIRVTLRDWGEADTEANLALLPAFADGAENPTLILAVTIP